MRTIILLLVVLIICSPAFGGTVTLSLQEVDGHTVELGYIADTPIIGFGLAISLDNGAVITSVVPEHVGECTATDKGYGIFPESFSTYLDASNPDWGDANYTPVAPNDAPGAAGTGIGTDTVILEMGALYEDGNAPALAGVLCTFTVSADCNVTLSAESTRGNVVQADTTQASFTGDSIVVCSGGCGCGGDGYWYPPCWDFATQCHGDVDGGGVVDTDDWLVFRNCFMGVQGIASPSYVANACADLDQDGDCDTYDWSAFRNTFMGPGGTAAPDCPIDCDALGVFMGNML